MTTQYAQRVYTLARLEARTERRFSEGTRQALINLGHSEGSVASLEATYREDHTRDQTDQS